MDRNCQILSFVKFRQNQKFLKIKPFNRLLLISLGLAVALFVFALFVFASSLGWCCWCVVIEICCGFL